MDRQSASQKSEKLLPLVYIQLARSSMTSGVPAVFERVLSIERLQLTCWMLTWQYGMWQMSLFAGRRSSDRIFLLLQNLFCAQHLPGMQTSPSSSSTHPFPVLLFKTESRVPRGKEGWLQSLCEYIAKVLMWDHCSLAQGVKLSWSISTGICTDPKRTEGIHKPPAYSQ